MKLFVHPVYGTKIPWLCRLWIHVPSYRHANATRFGRYDTMICSRCGWEERV